MGGLLHLVQRGGDWAGPQPARAPPAQSPPRCTKCNDPPINHQRPVYQSSCCTAYCVRPIAVQLPIKRVNTGLRLFSVLIKFKHLMFFVALIALLSRSISRLVSRILRQPEVGRHRK